MGESLGEVQQVTVNGHTRIGTLPCSDVYWDTPRLFLLRSSDRRMCQMDLSREDYHSRLLLAHLTPHQEDQEQG